MNRATLVSRPENSDDTRRRMLNLMFACAVALAAAMLIGCGSEADVDERSRGTGNQAVGSSDSSGAAAEMPGASTTNTSTFESQTIAVTLKDGEISMPTVMKPGPTTFNVNNAGQKEHTLEIEGGGQESGLNAELDAGQTASFEMDLQPGTYKAYCPVDDHEDKGMALQITVQP